MAIIKIQTIEEKEQIVAYLESSEAILVGLNFEERRSFERRARHFEYHNELLYFRKNENILLRFFVNLKEKKNCW